MPSNRVLFCGPPNPPRHKGISGAQRAGTPAAKSAFASEAR